jgi:hypothetical protein
MLACVLAGVDEVKDVFGVMADCGGMVWWNAISLTVD